MQETASVAASVAATARCPDRPSELGLTVRNDTWWPGQQETIDSIVEAFIDKGRKFVMAGIPTGGGKTLIASAVQKLLARHQMGQQSLVLTHTIQLQDQYQKTLTDAAVITGRSNWLCELSPDSEYRIGTDADNPLTAETAPCGEGHECPEDLKNADGCGYYQQWWTAARAPMVIMNYAYSTRILQIPYFGVDFPNPFRRSLLVADECHLAHDAVVDASGFKLWTGSLDRIGLQLPSLHTRIEVMEGGPRSQTRSQYENVPVWIRWAVDSLPLVGTKLHEAEAAFESMKAGHNTTGQKHALSRVRSLKAVRETLLNISRIDNPDEWIIRRDTAFNGRVTSVTVQPLWGWAVAHKNVFNYFKRVLLMSATPGNPEIARTKLGIPKEDFEYIERPSTFPRENRPVYFWPVAALGYRSSDADWDRVAKAIGWIATRPAHLNRKGLVHSGSHANAKRLVQLLDRYLPGRAFTHESGKGRDEAIARFKSSAEPLILVTASFTTGIDLPYVIGWQVIAKVPFGSLGDDITRRRKAFTLPNGYAFGQSCYTDDCANTVVQAAGRIVRAPDDSGPTFILDENWKIVARQAYLPKFFLDSYSKFVVE